MLIPAEHENFSLLINIKLPTIVDIFIFISKENFMLDYINFHKKLGFRLEQNKR